MTLAPAYDVEISVPGRQDWPEPEPYEGCCNPTCRKRGEQTHHVVRRSATAGPVRWVVVDGVVLLNEVRVCLWCHDDLNNHRAWIRYFTERGWLWYAAAPAAQAAGAAGSVQHPKSHRWFMPLGSLKGV
jgi:hypothetical protein